MHIGKMERFKWPIPNDEYLRRTIEEGETSTLEYRIERLRFVWEEFGPPADMLLVGGIPSMFALDELKRSYIYGNFIATVLLAQCFIEHSLGGSYSTAGKDKIANQGFAALIDAALKDGQLTGEVAQVLHTLRKMRNPYIHFIGGAGPKSYMGRLVKQAVVSPEDLAVKDAKFAIRAVVDYLRHGSPDWNPDKVHWQENNENA